MHNPILIQYRKVGSSVAYSVQSYSSQALTNLTNEGWEIKIQYQCWICGPNYVNTCPNPAGN